MSEDKEIDEMMTQQWQELPERYRRVILRQAKGALFWDQVATRVGRLKGPATFVTALGAAYLLLGDMVVSIWAYLKSLAAGVPK